ncbi:MAG TPA: signal peptidase I [Acidimicrobiales bacterium]|nr:signal peptidase I [Acidimicrobiales bacterium]
MTLTSWEPVLDEDAPPGLPPFAVEKPASPTRALKELPILLVIAGVIAFVVRTFVAQAFYIPSGSMLPQLQILDRVVVSKVAYKLHDPRRGDIVVFDNPYPRPAKAADDDNAVIKAVRGVGKAVGVVQPSTDEFIKRVIGLPGETVEGRQGHVYVNGRLLEEPYLQPSVTTSTFAPITVPRGQLWVMGDNRTNSGDSRVFGPIRESKVVGRAIVRVWPFGHASFL